jgi:Mlc titration factor MtfA (ptsG expression regulator)
MGWLTRLGDTWKARREAQALRERAIPEALWQHTVQRYPFIAERRDDDREELRRLATLFLDRKEFSGAGGLQATDEIAVAIAAQACLPILRLGLDAYDGFVGIVVHPDEVVVEREVMDEHGIVHAYEETLTGEAMEGGPVMLSWRDVAEAGDMAAWGYNVVIHEFAHVLDMRDGIADGVPLLQGRVQRERWQRTLQAEYEAFRDVVERHPDLDTVVDPYGAEAPEEFFAVSSEAYFVTPRELARAHPELYRLLDGYYRQDPAGIGGAG